MIRRIVRSIYSRCVPAPPPAFETLEELYTSPLGLASRAIVDLGVMSLTFAFGFELVSGVLEDLSSQLRLRISEDPILAGLSSPRAANSRSRWSLCTALRAVAIWLSSLGSSSVWIYLCP